MANIITCIRILCGLALMMCPLFSGWFLALYALGGISDAADGWTARRLSKVSEAGARLDTAADIVFFSAALIKVFCEVPFPLWIVVWTAAIAVIRILSIAVGFLRTRRLVACHTTLNRITGGMLFCLPPLIAVFPDMSVRYPAALTCLFATAASLQELSLSGKAALDEADALRG